MVVEFDDFGANHIISDQCQSHDCRDQLQRLRNINFKFKTTLFAIPGEMTPELLGWCQANSNWIELAVHGFFHTSNYECEKISYDDFDWLIGQFRPIISQGFQKIFRAPGWQISDDAMKWLADNDWVIADQGYNDARRPENIKAYVNYDNVFKVNGKEIPAYHGHTWNVGWNGIYEDFDTVAAKVKESNEFKFVSEVVA